MTNEELLKIARTINLPEWATHVAVRDDGSKVEPAAWVEAVGDYIDENPSTISRGDWAGGYKHCYWEFFSLDELK